MGIIESLKYVGIEAQVFMAGASGGIVLLAKNEKMTKTQQFLTVLSGGLSANYLTPLAGDWFHLDSKLMYGVAFLLGYSGMKSVELIITVFHGRLKKE